MTVLETVKLMPDMKGYRLAANGSCYPFNPSDGFLCSAFGGYQVERVNCGYEDGMVEFEIAVEFVKA